MLNQILIVLLSLGLLSCSGEKVPGRPSTIGGQPIGQFYESFSYQETSNEFILLGQGEWNIVIVLLEKFGQRTFSLSPRNEQNDQPPIVGDWQVNDREIIFLIKDKAAGQVEIGRGEGYRQTGGNPFIRVKFNQTPVNTRIPTALSNLVKMAAPLEALRIEDVQGENREIKQIYQAFLYDEEFANPNRKYFCLIGESLDASQSLLLRLEEFENEDGEEDENGDIILDKTVYYHDLKQEGRLIGNGPYEVDKDKITLFINVGGKKIEAAEGSFKKLLIQPVIRLNTKKINLGSRGSMAPNGPKKFNLFRLSKEDCQDKSQ